MPDITLSSLGGLDGSNAASIALSLQLFCPKQLAPHLLRQSPQVRPLIHPTASSLPLHLAHFPRPLQPSAPPSPNLKHLLDSKTEGSLGA